MTYWFVTVSTVLVPVDPFQCLTSIHEAVPLVSVQPAETRVHFAIDRSD